MPYVQTRGEWEQRNHANGRNPKIVPIQSQWPEPSCTLTIQVHESRLQRRVQEATSSLLHAGQCQSGKLVLVREDQEGTENRAENASDQLGK